MEELSLGVAKLSLVWSSSDGCGVAQFGCGLAKLGVAKLSGSKPACCQACHAGLGSNSVPPRRPLH